MRKIKELIIALSITGSITILPTLVVLYGYPSEPIVVIVGTICTIFALALVGEGIVYEKNKKEF